MFCCDYITFFNGVLIGVFIDGSNLVNMFVIRYQYYSNDYNYLVVIFSKLAVGFVFLDFEYDFGLLFFYQKNLIF